MVRIGKVRLICFHNFVDETITVDGHLFLVGSNGSGKTTVLDAIHYVLTGGELELNAAARIAGRKDEGRNAGDIVLRMNHNTGAMRPNGGISYAALELQDKDSRYCIGVGLRKDGPGQALHSWGFIFDAPLDDAFFIDEQRKLLDLHQMRAAHGDKGKIYGQISAYRDELCRRFFGGRENLHNLCRILNTAKSYREMVSKSMQYEELFKSLLPPPPEEVLTDFLAALQRLEDDRQEEQKWKERCAFLDHLDEGRRMLVELEEKRTVSEAMLVELEIRQVEDAMSDKRLLRRQTEERLVQLEDAILRQTEQISGMRARVTEMQGQDAEGLLRRRDVLREESSEQSSRVKRLQADVDEQHDDVAELQKKASALDSALREQLKALLTQTNRLQVDFDQDCTAAASELAELLRTGGLISQRIQCGGGLAAVCRKLHAQLDQNVHARQTSIAATEEELAEIEELLEELKRNPEIRPQSIYEFEDAEEELRMNALKAQPLYRLLEWRTDVDHETRAGLEQLLGEDVLATFLVSPPQYDKARKLLHPQYFGIRLARWETQQTSLPDWVHRYFDPATCDPAALAVLAEEMSSSTEPAILLEEDYILAQFRRHSTGFDYAEPRLIGEAHRLEQVQREIAAAEEERRDLSTQLKNSRKLLREETRCAREAADVRNAVDQTLDALTPLFDELIQAGGSLTSEQKRLEERRERLEEARDKLEQLQDDLAGTEAAIAEKGIDALKNEIARLHTALDAAETECGNLIERKGRAKQELASAETQLDELQKQKDSLQEQLHAHHEQISGRIPDTRIDACRRELAEFMASIRTITAARDEFTQLARVKDAQLREWMRDPRFSSIYDFSFDENTRQIFSRAGRTLDEVRTEATANYERTQQLLEEKNRETIHRIFGSSMVNVLYRNMAELGDMVSVMTRKLKGRQFGDTVYSFKISPKEEHQHIVQGIKELHNLNPEKDRILNHLYDEMRYAAREMVGNVIPERLDYRTWYDYELHMKVGEGEKRLTNRVRKSGSGGEQAVPNYILMLAAAHFFYSTYKTRMCPLLFDEGFYGIDAARQDQLLAFAADLGLQLIVATPDVDGTGKEIEKSTTAFLQKSMDNDVLVECFYWDNPTQPDLDWTPEQRVHRGDDVPAS